MTKNRAEEEFEREIPNIIVKESKKFGIKTDLEEIHIDNFNIPEAEKLVEGNAREEFEKQDFVVFLSQSKEVNDILKRVFCERFDNAFVLALDSTVKFDNLEMFSDMITEKINRKDIFLQINMNILDRAFAPGILEPEPLGLSNREFFYILRRLARCQGLKAISICGISREKDEKNDLITCKTAARILKEFARP